MSGLQDTVATQTRGTKQIKQGLIFLLSMWQKRRGYHGEQSGEALYLSQPVSSDILSPGKTEAAAAGSVSSACATFRRVFETYLMSSTQPLAWPGQSPSVKAGSAFAPGFPWCWWQHQLLSRDCAGGDGGGRDLSHGSLGG